MDPLLRERLLNSIENDRLVLFCGAGLSMSKPSRVPSAAALARTCSEAYERHFGITLDAETATDLEKMAEYFAERGLLVPTFIDKLIPRPPFRRDPNAGHYATADFLASGVIDFAVSTNVDTLTELAAEDLGEDQAFVAIDAGEANVARPHRQHLKLHGCIRRNDHETVWCKSQLTKEPIQSRLRDFDTWLRAHLVGRDVVFLGFWSDWGYLNQVFERSVDAIGGGFIAIVNPSDEAMLAEKAPHLWEWSGNGTSERFLVRQSAAEFLDELRGIAWTHFMNRLLRQGAETYQGLTASNAAFVPLPEGISVEEVYRLKQDACSCPSGSVSRMKRPNATMNMVGAVHHGLRQNGAELEGSVYRLGGQRIRVLNAQGQLLTPFRSRFEGEPQPFPPIDVVVCVGATDDGGMPLNIARGNKTNATTVRPSSSGEWITETQAAPLWREVANVATS